MQQANGHPAPGNRPQDKVKPAAWATSLNIRQQRFVQEYIIDFNATQAYIRAGYSEQGASTAASRLLANAKIKPFIQAALEKRAEKSELSEVFVLDGLRDTYDKAIAKDQLAAANRALELLGRHIGMFSERLEVDSSDRLTTLLEAIQARPRPGPVLEHEALPVPPATLEPSDKLSDD